MKTWFIAISALIALSAQAGTKKTTTHETTNMTPEATRTYADINKTMGLVPDFVKTYPTEGIEGAWEEMKGIELNPNTALTGKHKELIGLALAAQIPCKYCTIFHTEAAKLNGATTRELHEAVAAAASTRHWSAVVNGLQLDEATFHKDVATILETMKKRTTAGTTTPTTTTTPVTVTDAKTAYQDMEQTLGVVPQFMKLFPEEGIAGAWKDLKMVQMNPNSALPGKLKELIGIALSAQIPCHYCTYFHTEFARANGATDREIREAVAMAALTRRWSTVLNGNLTDETTFRRQVTQVMTHAKKHMTGRTAAADGTETSTTN